MKNVTLGTSQTNTNDHINNLGTTTNTFNIAHTGANTAGYMWSHPTRLEVNELNDSIEMIYEETSLVTLTIYPSPPLVKRYFKIVFSCLDGKWNKSERIYGKKIEHQEYFEF